MSILNKIFGELAKLPLVGPHAAREKDLLLAGAKPLGTFWQKFDDGEIAALNTAVNDGKLICKTFTRIMPEVHHFYTLPGQEDNAVSFARDELSARHHPTDQNQREQALATSRKRSHLASRHASLGETLKDIFLREAAKTFGPLLASKRFSYYKHKTELDSTLMIRAVAAGALPHTALRDCNIELCPKILDEGQHHITSGKIIYFKEFLDYKEDFLIYGQPGQEDNLERLGHLTQNLYSTAHEKTHEELVEGAREEGRLLGFSDRDTDLWCSGAADINPITKFLLINTNPFRRKIRQDLMLQSGPNWQRNP